MFENILDNYEKKRKILEKQNGEFNKLLNLYIYIHI